MEDSPIQRLIEAVDQMDVDAVMALMAPDPSFHTVDGIRAHGREEVSRTMSDFLAKLRSMSHRITNEWHVDDVWIAEVDSDYVLLDYLEMKDMPRVFILRFSGGRISEVRVYGANEQPFSEQNTDDRGFWTGRRWIPPL